jgi:drug/metabolite transporter (DMT)-like permease
MISVGVSMALYKMPSFKGYSSFHSAFWTNLFTLLFALIVFVAFSPSDDLFVISFYGLLWGSLFVLTMVQQKILLKRIETNTLLPVTASLSNVLTVGFGIFLFSDAISLLQWVAVILILSSVFFYSKKEGGLILDTNSVALGLGIVLTSTISKVVQKFSATHDTIFHFAIYQYLGAALFALILIYIFERKTFPKLFHIRNTWKFSLINAFFMSIAGFSFLKALSTGPISGVFSIAAGYTFVTAIVGVLLYKEILTSYKILLMCVTLLGIILMKLG